MKMMIEIDHTDIHKQQTLRSMDFIQHNFWRVVGRNWIYIYFGLERAADDHDRSSTWGSDGEE